MLRLKEPLQLHEELSEAYWENPKEMYEDVEKALFTLKKLLTKRIEHIIEDVPFKQTANYLIKILTSLDIIKNDRSIQYEVRLKVSDYIEIIENDYGRGYIQQYIMPTHHLDERKSRRYQGKKGSDTRKRNELLEKLIKEINRKESADAIYSPQPS